MGNRFTVELVPRLTRMSDVKAFATNELNEALNNPEHRPHGLEGIYAIENFTVIVWRVNTL
jgi:hypothetical protein